MVKIWDTGCAGRFMLAEVDSMTSSSGTTGWSAFIGGSLEVMRFTSWSRRAVMDSSNLSSLLLVESVSAEILLTFRWGYWCHV
jgi:hypothetical protein